MKKLIERIQQSKRNELKKRSGLPAGRQVFGGTDWMREQLTRMTQLNQGLVSMSVGR